MLRVLRFLTAGESHGPCLTAILEGMPAGLALDEDAINNQLARRQVGFGRGGRMKIEKDRAEILSGVGWNGPGRGRTGKGFERVGGAGPLSPWYYSRPTVARAFSGTKPGGKVTASDAQLAPHALL